jgi:hypothetical protein
MSNQLKSKISSLNDDLPRSVNMDHEYKLTQKIENYLFLEQSNLQKQNSYKFQPSLLSLYTKLLMNFQDLLTNVRQNKLSNKDVLKQLL